MELNDKFSVDNIVEMLADKEIAIEPLIVWNSMENYLQTGTNMCPIFKVFNAETGEEIGSFETNIASFDELIKKARGTGGVIKGKGWKAVRKVLEQHRKMCLKIENS